MDNETTSPNTVRRDLLSLALACLFFFFAALGARDLWNPNEPIYGRAVVEMAERGDWLVPTVNDQVFAEKPILYYWGALAASSLLGEIDEFSLRVPSAVAASISVLLTYLLVLPYLGRRRAWLAALLFMTMYQVFWAARAVQMDVLVLAATLGVVVPMTRWLDFRAPAARSLALAGLAAGLGFAAKGPVSWVLPGVALGGYVVWTGRLRWILRQPLWIGVVVTVISASPWYLMLWAMGQGEMVYEVLIRQNFVRFVDAWDHHQPWWYFLEYIWIDYFPWSWLLPAAALLRVENDRERQIRRLSWAWVLGVILFFSLSESKRAPYILPLAPAVAALGSLVVDRWCFGPRLERAPRVVAKGALAVIALVFVLVAVAAFVPAALEKVPEHLVGYARGLGVLFGLTGLAVAIGLVTASRRPSVAPAALFSGMATIYLFLVVAVFPAVDSVKSARSFASAMDERVTSADGTLASYGFWDWRSGYSYYAERSIPLLRDEEDLEAYWREVENPFVLAEDDEILEVRKQLPDAREVLDGRIGSRHAVLFAKESHKIEREGVDSVE